MSGLSGLQDGPVTDGLHLLAKNVSRALGESRELDVAHAAVAVAQTIAHVAPRFVSDTAGRHRAVHATEQAWYGVAAAHNRNIPRPMPPL
jgi:hypothetical protein